MASPVTFCSVEGCTGRVKGNGLCPKHYARVRRYGSTELPPRTRETKPCTVCGGPAVARGFCRRHYRARHLKSHGAGRPCGVAGCDQPLLALGMCERHYDRWRRTGTTDDPKRRSLEERFWEKVDRRGPDECWEWKAAKSNGYGAFGRHNGGGGNAAHRVAYELMVGPIPPEMELHHVCENRGCVNPAHLAPKHPTKHYVLTWVKTLRSLGYTVVEPAEHG